MEGQQGGHRRSATPVGGGGGGLAKVGWLGCKRREGDMQASYRTDATVWHKEVVSLPWVGGGRLMAAVYGSNRP
jgi:hypothetical protein